MKKSLIILLIFAVAIIVGFKFTKNTKQTSGEPIKIGIASLLTGGFAVVGENIRDTAELAVDQINKKGGINGRPVQLIVEDSKCDSKTGLSAVSKLINVDQVKYIVGGMCSNGTIAAAPLANKQKVLILTPVTGGKNVDEAGEYIFRTANSDILAGVDIASAMAKMGFKKVGAVTEITEYTLDIEKSFKQKIQEFGGLLAIEENFQPGTDDFRTTVAKMKAAHIQAVLVASQTGISGAHFVKQAREQGLNIPMFSDFTFVANSDARKIVGSFDVIYFADPQYDSNKPELKSFFQEYQQKYNHAPTIPFHAAATYDAINMITTAIRSVGDDSVKVHDWLLSNVKNWDGFMGRFSLDAKGKSDLGFVIKQIQNGKAVEIK